MYRTTAGGYASAASVPFQFGGSGNNAAAISNNSAIANHQGYAFPDAVLHSQMQQQRAKYYQIYAKLDTQNKGVVTIGSLVEALKQKGLEPFSNAEIKSTLQDTIARAAQSQPNLKLDNIQDVLDVEVNFEDFFKIITGTNTPTAATPSSPTSATTQSASSSSSDLLQQENNIIQRAFTKKLAVPDWETFVREITEIFEEVKHNGDGKNADYIPHLRNTPNYFGLSICTVDGQRFSMGNFDAEFTLQSCGNVFAYCVACEDVGVEKVHQFVGFEPSGGSFNAFELDEESKPHNPMINAGAITVYSLLQPKCTASERFMFLSNRFAEFAGGLKIGFDNSVFLAEKDSSDKNIALAYYMVTCYIIVNKYCVVMRFFF